MTCELEVALAAAAAAWAAGLNPVMIARGLTTFETNTESAPGRFNVQEINGIEVIFDYGHNVGGMRALAEAVRALGATPFFGDIIAEGNFVRHDPAALAQTIFQLYDRYGRALERMRKES